MARMKRTEANILKEDINDSEAFKMPKNFKTKLGKIKYVIYLFLVVIITVVTTVLMFKKNHTTLAQVTNILGKANFGWVIFAIIIVGIMACLRAMIYFCFARLFTRDYHYRQAIAVDQVGTFYNSFTPAGTASSVSTSITFKNQGLNISSAVSISAMYLLIHNITLIFYGVLALIVKRNYLFEVGGLTITLGSAQIHLSMTVLTIIGFALNLCIIGVILLMSYWKGFHNFIMGPCVNLLTKLKLVKKPEKVRENLRTEVENFKIEMRRIFTNIPFAILIFSLFFWLLTFKYSLPFFVGEALGNESQVGGFWDSAFIGNYHHLITHVIPIPGSAGISELFFNTLFVTSNNATATNSFFFKAVYDSAGIIDQNATNIASQELTTAATILWRIVSYLLPLIISAIVTGLIKFNPADEEIGGELPTRQTFIALQQKTMDVRYEELETMINTSVLTKKQIKEKLKESRRHKNRK